MYMTLNASYTAECNHYETVTQIINCVIIESVPNLTTPGSHN